MKTGFLTNLRKIFKKFLFPLSKEEEVERRKQRKEGVSRGISPTALISAEKQRAFHCEPRSGVNGDLEEKTGTPPPAAQHSEVSAFSESRE